MTDSPNPDPRHPFGRDRGRNWRIQHTRPAAGGRHPGRNPDSPSPRDPTEDLRQLSLAEERDLHFSGFPPYDLQPLHELCPPGGCQYKTLAENIADLDWLIAQDRAPGHDDPEAGL
jgi:hypothetical protein